MADFYPYLISSLPMLHYGAKPPFSFERFLDMCRPFTPGKDYRILDSLPRPEHYAEGGERHECIKKWIEFDTALRNELVRIRAGKKNVEPAMYIREGGSSSLITIPISASGMQTSLLDTERALDELRWKRLEDLATCHYFDLDYLITYGYHLLILERWENIRSSDGKAMFRKILQS